MMNSEFCTQATDGEVYASVELNFATAIVEHKLYCLQMLIMIISSVECKSSCPAKRHDGLTRVIAKSYLPNCQRQMRSWGYLKANWKQRQHMKTWRHWVCGRWMLQCSLLFYLTNKSVNNRRRCKMALAGRSGSLSAAKSNRRTLSKKGCHLLPSVCGSRHYFRFFSLSVLSSPWPSIILNNANQQQVDLS